MGSAHCGNLQEQEHGAVVLDPSYHPIFNLKCPGLLKMRNSRVLFPLEVFCWVAGCGDVQDEEQGAAVLSLLTIPTSTFIWFLSIDLRFSRAFSSKVSCWVAACENLQEQEHGAGVLTPLTI